MTMSAQSPIAVDWHMGQNNTSANNYNSRFVIMNYFRYMQKQGKEVDAQIEGRVVVK